MVTNYKPSVYTDKKILFHESVGLTNNEQNLKFLNISGQK